MSRVPSPPSSLRPWLLGGGALLSVWALAVGVTGGFTVLAGDVRLSSRNATRPLLAALALVGLGLWRTSAAERSRLAVAAARTVDRVAPGVAAGVGIVLVVTSTLFGSHVAGGADSSGYLSQARLWAAGRVAMTAEALPEQPWPMRGRLVAPFGYRPTARPDELGATYAPGLPWLMALGAAFAGDAGRYVWTPMLAGLLAWGTWRWTTHRAPPAVGLAAVLLVAGSPPLLFQATQTMSDLPVAALWIAALVAFARSGAVTAVAGGTLAGLALVVRPNLTLAAAGVWLGAVLADDAPWPARLRRAALRGLPLAAAAGAIAVLNTRLWGSPLVSGYGAAADLFAAANVPPNLAALWRWTVETDGYWTLVGLIALPWLALRRGGRLWWPAIGLVAGVLVNYLAYASFAEWWYLRFYLPAWPVLAAASAIVGWHGLARWSDAAARIAVVVAGLAAGLHGATQAHAFGVFDLWRGDQRYKDVGHWVDTHAGREAVVVAVQHSGAQAYYSGRTILRFDELAADALDATTDRLAAAGRPVWLVVDDWEEPIVRARFAGQRRGRLDWAPLAEARAGAARVRVYDLADPTRATGPAFIAVAAGGPWPWARRAPAQ